MTKWVKWISAVLFVTQVSSVLAAPMAADPSPSPISAGIESTANEKIGARQRFANGVNSFCELVLLGFEKHVPKPLQGPLVGAGYIVPVIPLFELLRNSDKTFFVAETWILGLVNTPAAVEMANLLNGHGNEFGTKFLTDTKELYISYQSANVVRTGVAIDESLSKNTRAWLNWWYSTAFYAWQTAGHKLAMATTPTEKVHAWSLVVFSGLWPIFSQRVSQYILTPLLFSKFPKESLLKKIHDPEMTSDALIAAQEATIVKAKAKIEELGVETSENQIELGKAKDELMTAEYNVKWVKWFRKGLADGQVIPKKRDLKYWSIKTGASTGAAVVMVALYLLVRRALVGDDKDEKTIMHGMLKYFIDTAGLAKQASGELIESAEREVNALMGRLGDVSNFVPVFPN